MKPNPKALIPIFVFLILYLGNGIFFEYISPSEGQMGFYVVSVVLAFTVALFVAFLQNKIVSFNGLLKQKFLKQNFLKQKLLKKNFLKQKFPSTKNLASAV